VVAPSILPISLTSLQLTATFLLVFISALILPPFKSPPQPLTPAAMEDFNSSDVEFDPPPRNPFHKAGKASVMKMLDHALEDRLASKKKVKQLTFVKGSRSTQYIHALWWNRFTGFRQNTLTKGYGQRPIGQTWPTDNCCSPEVSPQSEDLERFFNTIVSRVQPKTNQVPSYHWLKSAVAMTIQNCVFHHKDFTLSPHERLRIATLLDSLLQDGRLTMDPSWERNWAGVVVVRKLVSSLVNQAFEEGTMTWDITISKCLSIVLVAALGARTGDVTVAPLDRHTLPYLAYKDIVVRMDEEGSTIDNLEAVLALRNEKGDKYVNRGPRCVVLGATLTCLQTRP
jgi:hypothetical protein